MGMGLGWNGDCSPVQRPQKQFALPATRESRIIFCYQAGMHKDPHPHPPANLFLVTLAYRLAWVVFQLAATVTPAISESSRVGGQHHGNQSMSHWFSAHQGPALGPSSAPYYVSRLTIHSPCPQGARSAVGRDRCTGKA